MHKDAARKIIEEQLQSDDTLIGFFMAQQSPPIWLFFLIGPFAALSLKTYFVGVSERGVYFHRLSMTGKFAHLDFFEYGEIAGLTVGKGMLQRPMKFFFSSDRTLLLKAQLKGVERVAKLDEATQRQLESRIPAHK
ncbi:MAG: hypothetical protein NXI24_16610 [bacterium]|nr:hypothetical protein [bacterium]